MTDMSVRDFLASREAELKEKKSAIVAELAEIKALKSALDGVSPAAGRKKSAEPTIKDMIVEVLEDSPGGSTSDEIIAMVAEKYGKSVPRSSMSPQLSRLKNDDLVARESDKWLLPKFASQAVEGASNPNTALPAHDVDNDRQQNRLPVGIPPSVIMPAPSQDEKPTPVQGGSQLMPNRTT